MARTAQHELSDEAKQAIASADAEASLEADLAAFGEGVDESVDDFDPASLSTPYALPAELAKDSAPKNARNDGQLAVDGVVRDVHAKWLEAGEPRTWPLIVETGSVAGYWVKPQSEPKIRKMVKSAADMLGVSVRYGRTTPRAEGMEQDGRVFVNFAILTTKPLSDEVKAKMATAREARRLAKLAADGS